MISIDSNVLVRFLTRDDEAQFQKVLTLFAKNDIFIPTTVILETEWVLRYSYGFTLAAILDAFIKTLGLQNVKIQHPEAVAKAIDFARQDLDFADALHLALSRECKQFATFDQALIKKTKGLGSCTARKP